MIMANEKIDIEKSIKRLDEIVNVLENEALPLEKCLAYYEEGKKLISSLEKSFKEAEEKIEKLSKDSKEDK